MQGGEPERAAGRAHEGHQRRARQEDAGRLAACRSSAPTRWPRPRRRSSPRRSEAKAEGTTCRILINKDTKVITQGITGKTGQFHTAHVPRLRERQRTASSPASTRRRPGEDFEGIPIFATRQGSGKETPAPPCRVIYVPPAGAAAAIWEAVEADLDLAICITEGIPVRDMLEVRSKMQAREARAARRRCCSGPNCPGLITPDEIKIGIMPGHIHRKGRIGVVSPLGHADLRSGRAAHRARPRPVERGRHRRRPDQRPEAHRRHEALQRRPGHRRGHHDRRDRRPRRGRRGALVQGQHEEAGRRLHRRRHGAAGQAHGPRRRADLGRRRHGRRQARRHGRVRLHGDAQPVGDGHAAEGAASERLREQRRPGSATDSRWKH